MGVSRATKEKKLAIARDSSTPAGRPPRVETSLRQSRGTTASSALTSVAVVVEGIDPVNRGRRVIVKGRVVAECSALSEGENHTNAHLIATAFNLRASAPPDLAETLSTLTEVDEILQQTDSQTMIGRNTTMEYLRRVTRLLRSLVAAQHAPCDPAAARNTDGLKHG